MNKQLVIKQMVALPIGEYRFLLNQIRRARRGDVTKKIPSRRIRQSAEDVRWSQDVRVRDGWTCKKCGVWGLGRWLDAAHIITRRYKKTRRLLENGLSLCRKDHRWAHDHPAEFKEWVIGEIGQSEYDRLYALAHSGKG